MQSVCSLYEWCIEMMQWCLRAYVFTCLQLCRPALLLTPDRSVIKHHLHFSDCSMVTVFFLCVCLFAFTICKCTVCDSVYPWTSFVLALCLHYVLWYWFLMARGRLLIDPSASINMLRWLMVCVCVCVCVHVSVCVNLPGWWNDWWEWLAGSLK